MGIGNRINEIGAEGDGKPSSGDPTTWPGYKKEEVKDKNNTYDTTGGLPATLRYPNTALDDSMDFLDIVMELRKQHGIDVPEAEYRELESLDSCGNYLLPKFEASAAA